MAVKFDLSPEHPYAAATGLLQYIVSKCMRDAHRGATPDALAPIIAAWDALQARLFKVLDESMRTDAQLLCAPATIAAAALAAACQLTRTSSSEHVTPLLVQIAGECEDVLMVLVKDVRRGIEMTVTKLPPDLNQLSPAQVMTWTDVLVATMRDCEAVGPAEERERCRAACEAVRLTTSPNFIAEADDFQSKVVEARAARARYHSTKHAERAAAAAAAATATASATVVAAAPTVGL